MALAKEAEAIRNFSFLFSAEAFLAVSFPPAKAGGNLNIYRSEEYNWGDTELSPREQPSSSQNIPVTSSLR
jgi:hypothetical protein